MHAELISKQLLVASTVLFMASVLVQGQGGKGRASQNYETEQELRALDRQWGKALVRRDVVTLKRLLSDDYTRIEPSGQVITKAQEISEVESPVFALAIKSYRTESVSVSINNNKATLTGRVVLGFILDEQEVTRRYWYTRTFAKWWGRWGRWRIIAAQMIELPEDGKKETYPQKVAAIIGICSPAVSIIQSNEPTPTSSDCE
jgi:hypothetical protein